MSLFLNALQGKNSVRPPIWLMRQAGRYMPQYQEIKKKHGLMAMFQESDLIIQTTLLPINLLDLDAAILFTDILTLLSGFDRSWTIEEGIGPKLQPLSDPSELKERESQESFASISFAIKELKKILKCPLIGFAGGPFTIAAYLIEGKISKDLRGIKKWIYESPERLHSLLEKITAMTVNYLILQGKSGVDVIQIFDSWAGLLTPAAFAEFSLKYLQQIIQKLSGQNLPVILFCRGSTLYGEALAALKPTAISFDWLGDMSELAKKIPSSIALQGNLDPCVLLGSKEQIKAQVSQQLHSMKGSPRYIFNLGHGVLPETPFSNVQYLVECVKQYR